MKTREIQADGARARFSMAGRLVVAFAGSFIGLSLFSGVIFYFLVKNQLHSQRQLLLQDRIEAVTTLLQMQDKGLEELHDRIEREWPLRGGETFLIQVASADGQMVIASPGFDLLRHHPDYMTTTNMIESSIPSESKFKVTAAIGIEQENDFLAIMRELLGVTSIASILISLWVGWLVVRREIRPLRKIAEQLARVNTGNMRKHVQMERLPLELELLANAFNATFDRLAEAFDRLERFSSDVAHELRTPISNAMSTIEVGLARSRSALDYREILESSMEECGRLSRICDNLLFLARAENQSQVLIPSVFHPRSEIERVIEYFGPLAEEKQIRMVLRPTTESLQEGTIVLDSGMFERLLVNLLANAIRYSREDRQVEIGWDLKDSAGKKQLIVWIEDQGEGISADSLPHIFDRFYRVDSSRNQRSGGTGLGLAIVKGIVDLHGGSIGVESKVGFGTRFTLILPTLSNEDEGARQMDRGENNRHPGLSR